MSPATTVSVLPLGSAWFEYSSGQSTLPWNDTSPLDDVDLGAALDTHSSVDGYLRDGVYQRRFQRGIAERCDEPPAVSEAREVGSFGFG